jgi:toxin ParE1/3/4
VSFQVLVETSAKLDLKAAFEWYEDQQIGLGIEFLNSSENEFKILEENPEIYQVIFEEIRRAPIKRFPFGLFYVIRNMSVHVVAVYHARRDPDGWKKRIYGI